MTATLFPLRRQTAGTRHARSWSRRCLDLTASNVRRARKSSSSDRSRSYHSLEIEYYRDVDSTGRVQKSRILQRNGSKLAFSLLCQWMHERFNANCLFWTRRRVYFLESRGASGVEVDILPLNGFATFEFRSSFSCKIVA